MLRTPAPLNGALGAIVTLDNRGSGSSAWPKIARAGIRDCSCGLDALCKPKAERALEVGPLCTKNGVNRPVASLKVYPSSLLSQALRVLAVTSCNKLEMTGDAWLTKSLDFTGLPWDDTVRRLCKDQEFDCWAKSGVLYAKVKYARPQQRVLRNFYDQH